MKKLSFLLLLFPLFELSAQLPTAGLVAHYPLNNEAGDKSGNGNHGELKGGVTAAQDRHGNPCGALRFNGKDGYISVPSSASLKSPVNSMAIAVWVKVERVNTSTNHLYIPLLSKSSSDNTSAAQAQYRFFLKRLFGDSYSDLAFSSGFTAQDKNYTTHPIEFDEWYFVVVSYEENMMQMYLNGKLVWQSVNMKPFTPNDFPLEIGRDMGGDVKYFNGCIDDLRIYRRGLSGFEAAALFEDVSEKSLKTGASISMPQNITKNTDAGKCHAVVSYAEPVISIGCGKAELKRIRGGASGSAFETGKHNIVYEATTESGAVIRDSFIVEITDKEAPVITCQKDTTVSSAGRLTEVDFKRPTATDNCPNTKVEILSSSSQGAVLPLGMSIITYQATDASGNKSTCSVKVTVIEDVRPVVHCTKDVSAFTGPSAKTARVVYEEPYLELKGVRTAMKRIKGTASGSEFPVGKHEVVFQEGDMTCSLFITVKDTVSPVMICPPDVRRVAASGTKTATVSYSTPKALDGGAEVPVKMMSGLSSGSEFPVGITKVIFQAVDESGNKSECMFNVTVAEDEVKPVLHCTRDVTAYTPSNRKIARVVFEEPYYDMGGTKTPMQRITGLASGSDFPVGVTEIVFESSVSWATERCSVKVTVKDTSSPVIICPASVTKSAPYGKRFMPVAYEMPSATDGGAPLAVRLVSGFGSGSDFPEGVTRVKYEAIDEAGNKAQCEFNVVVNQENPPVAVTKPEVKQEPVINTETKPAPPSIADEKVADQPPVVPAKPAVTETQPTSTEEKIKEAAKPFMFPDEETAEKKKEEAAPEVKTEKVEKIGTQLPKAIEVPAVVPAVIEPPVNPVAVRPVKSAKPMVLVCSNNVVKTADPGKCGAFVNYPAPAVSGGTEPKIFQTGGLKSSAFFPVGNTRNVYNAIDGAGYKQECSFNVTVTDNQAPVFNCPTDTTILLPANRRGVIYYYNNPTATDNCRLDSVEQTIGSKNGCFLQIGVHPFTFKAVDASGNYDICTFSVIVKEDERIVLPAPPSQLMVSEELEGDSVQYQYKADVGSCLLTVLMYDDGQEDDDMVSIIFNGQVLVHKEVIRLKENGAIIRQLVLDRGVDNYLIAKAWNTGRYGLNTLKIEVYEGILADSMRDLKSRNPSLVKVLHSKPGIAGGILLKCTE